MPDDDRLLVRPYVAPSGLPSGSTAPAWPEESGRVSVPTRFGPPAAVPEPPRVPPPASSPVPPARPGADRRAGFAFAWLALLALGAAGVLALLLLGPEQEEPPRAVALPDLSVPMLPVRSPGAGEDPSPAAESVRPVEPPAPSTTAPAVPAPQASASRDPKPSAPAGTQPPEEAGTLRPGDRGAEVRALQERLYAQGFTYVSVTGVYDGHTRRGVTQLQQHRSIKGDPQGIYGPATRAAFPIDG
ncbi:peptidoglycan-binding protein [Streptomyces sp. ISL-43]|uniref:peptidoglycan-binding protein n=1 Tax=Streptomyces sp. ISL-43 TaxID=2819183 RepID=UPI001BEC0FEB|nr:peptidoglycan-binding protein [Streptomyces sp. ISL-43]MBT2449546.1 peptidoglycan-binding protein [Streptomyces sp. ISL-43]